MVDHHILWLERGPVTDALDIPMIAREVKRDLSSAFAIARLPIRDRAWPRHYCRADLNRAGIFECAGAAVITVNVIGDRLGHAHAVVVGSSLRVRDVRGQEERAAQHSNEQ